MQLLLSLSAQNPCGFNGSRTNNCSKKDVLCY